MVGEVDALGVVVGRPHRLVLVHADLFDDDVLLHVEVLVAQAGPQDVGEDVHRLRQVLRQDGGVKDGVLLAGEGVVVGADAVEIAVDVQGRAPRRPLEDHVLQEVRDAGDLRRLVARPGADEEAQRDGARRRAGLADDLQAVGEHVADERHGISPSHVSSRTCGLSGGWQNRRCSPTAAKRGTRRGFRAQA